MGFAFYVHRDNPILHVFVCNAYKHDELSNSKYYISTVEPQISDAHGPGPWPEHKKNRIIRGRKSSLTGSTKSIIVEKHMYKTSMLIKYVQRKRPLLRSQSKPTGCGMHKELRTERRKNTTFTRLVFLRSWLMLRSDMRCSTLFNLFKKTRNQTNTKVMLLTRRNIDI